MDDTALRLIIVAGLVVASGAIAYGIGRDRSNRPRAIDPGSLGPGVYLLTSPTCFDCHVARATMAAALPDGGYTEIDWDSEPETFATLGIEVVPATLIVDESGDGTLYPGSPHRALKSLNP